MKKQASGKKIEFNPGFREALHLMENTSRNVFITGRAGTGKSTLLDYFRRSTDKKAVVLAPTGVAALNVGGETIHSFFGFGPDITADKVRKTRRRNAGIYREIDVLIIDEISMGRADLLDCSDRFLRLNGKTPSAPFGGVQMVFVGDLYQLPPVVGTNEEKEIFSNYYRSEYFFDSNVFNELSCDVVELNKVYRQKDGGFINLLNRFRSNMVSEEDLEAINERVDARPGSEGDRYTVYLTTTNRMASALNSERLDKLPGDNHVYRARAGGECPGRYYPTEPMLLVKPGAQVMLLNNDGWGRWVNGTVCMVKKILRRSGAEDLIRVELPGGRQEDISPYRWKVHKYIYNEKKGAIETTESGYFEQYPVKLAWAITIHKSQGQTFDRVIIDTGRGTFAPGQMYVALSRCTSLEGITLKRKISRDHMLVDERVVRFLREKGLMSDGMASSV